MLAHSQMTLLIARLAVITLDQEVRRYPPLLSFALEYIFAGELHMEIKTSHKYGQVLVLVEPHVSQIFRFFCIDPLDKILRWVPLAFAFVPPQACITSI